MAGPIYVPRYYRYATPAELAAIQNMPDAYPMRAEIFYLYPPYFEVDDFSWQLDDGGLDDGVWAG